MSEPKSNRLRRALQRQSVGIPGLSHDPLRGGADSEIQFVGGLPINSSNKAAVSQLGAGRQGGGGPVGAGIGEIVEHGSGVPSGSSNPAAVDPSMRFGVDSHSQRLTAANPAPNTKRGPAAPFTLKPGHGNGEE